MDEDQQTNTNLTEARLKEEFSDGAFSAYAKLKLVVMKGQESTWMFTPTNYDNLQKWQDSLGAVGIRDGVPQRHLNGVATSTGHRNVDCGRFSDTGESADKRYD